MACEETDKTLVRAERLAELGRYTEINSEMLARLRSIGNESEFATEAIRARIVLAEKADQSGADGAEYLRAYGNSIHEELKRWYPEPENLDRLKTIADFVLWQNIADRYRYGDHHSAFAGLNSCRMILEKFERQPLHSERIFTPPSTLTETLYWLGRVRLHLHQPADAWAEFMSALERIGFEAEEQLSPRTIGAAATDRNEQIQQLMDVVTQTAHENRPITSDEMSRIIHIREQLKKGERDNDVRESTARSVGSTLAFGLAQCLEAQGEIKRALAVLLAGRALLLTTNDLWRLGYAEMSISSLQRMLGEFGKSWISSQRALHFLSILEEHRYYRAWVFHRLSELFLSFHECNEASGQTCDVSPQDQWLREARYAATMNHLLPYTGLEKEGTLTTNTQLLANLELELQYPLRTAQKYNDRVHREFVVSDTDSSGLTYDTQNRRRGVGQEDIPLREAVLLIRSRIACAAGDHQNATDIEQLLSGHTSTATQLQALLCLGEALLSAHRQRGPEPQSNDADPPVAELRKAEVALVRARNESKNTNNGYVFARATLRLAEIALIKNDLTQVRRLLCEYEEGRAHAEHETIRQLAGHVQSEFSKRQLLIIDFNTIEKETGAKNVYYEMETRLRTYAVQQALTSKHGRKDEAIKLLGVARGTFFSWLKPKEKKPRAAEKTTKSGE